MRINVYAEELTHDIEIVRKAPENHPDVTFRAIRVFLKSPDDLHHSEQDDDRSAITIWVPWTRAGGHNFETVISMLLRMANAMIEEQIRDEVADLTKVAPSE